MISTHIILDTRRQKQDGTYPAKLQVTFARQTRWYSTGKSYTEADFAKIDGDKPRGDFKKEKRELNKFEEKAQAAIETLPAFTFDGFKKALTKGRKTITENVFDRFDDKAAAMFEEGRIGTGNGYKNAKISFQAFTGKKVLRFNEITVRFLNTYEHWMINKQGNSPTSAGYHLRNLRSILNDEITRGNLSRDLYPFGKGRYIIPSSKGRKIALDEQEIELIKTFEAFPGSPEERYKDFWLFMYHANGMNPCDMLRLRWRDMTDTHIYFIRKKTERTKKASTDPIPVTLVPRLREIISKWGNEDKSPDAYIFPILNESDSPDKQKADTAQFTKMVNTYIQKVAAKREITKKITTYVARHSWATMMMRKGAPLPLISKLLGHSSLKVTQDYLGDFEVKVMDEFAFAL